MTFVREFKLFTEMPSIIDLKEVDSIFPRTQDNKDIIRNESALSLIENSEKQRKRRRKLSEVNIVGQE